MICTEDGVFNSCEDPTTLEEAKEFALTEVANYSKYMRATILSVVSPFEAASWPLKLAQANSYPDNCQGLAIEAEARGVPLDALVAKVIQKGQQLAYVEAVIAGRTGYHSDRIKELTSLEEVIAYDWRFTV